MNKSMFFLKKDDQLIEISFVKKHVYIYETLKKRNYFFSHKNQEIITCMSLEKFNEYVKMHNYLIIERTSL